jgi:hypothetical protein
MRRSSRLSMTLSNHSQRHDSPWDTAIQDAEAEISLISRQRARLRQAIKIFKLNKKEGIEWPGPTKGGSCAG